MSLGADAVGAAASTLFLELRTSCNLSLSDMLYFYDYLHVSFKVQRMSRRPRGEQAAMCRDLVLAHVLYVTSRSSHSGWRLSFDISSFPTPPVLIALPEQVEPASRRSWRPRPAVPCVRMSSQRSESESVVPSVNLTMLTIQLTYAPVAAT